MWFCTQVRVYAVGDLGDDLFADEAPQQPVAVHRLPQKMSSIAWCPDDEVGRPCLLATGCMCGWL